jgi:hypothetical protein
VTPYEQEIEEATAEARLVWRALMEPALNQRAGAERVFEGGPVRHLGAIVIAGDETCFFLCRTEDV